MQNAESARVKDNASYYDDFSSWYERERHHGYHAMLDRLQVGVVRPLALGRDVLEIGCGTGLILKEVAPFARQAIGLDISRGMLGHARDRGLAVVEGSATDLPFPEGAFDTVYSFKVLAHVEHIRRAMDEVSRVLRPGGRAALEFYNRHSLRYAIKRIKKPNAVSSTTNDHEVYTRYDTLGDVRSYLPDTLRVLKVHGIRVVTPFAQVHRVPLLGQAMRLVETVARDTKGVRRLGGFMVVVVERS